MRREPAAAPHLFDAEVLHRLVRFGKLGVLTPHELDTAVEDLRDAPITRVDQRPLLERAKEFSVALSGYDAIYAALAEGLEATLVTGDRGLAETARVQFGLTVNSIV